MSKVIQFPTHASANAPVRAPTSESLEERISYEAMRRELQSEAQTQARTPSAQRLTDYLGTPDPQAISLPFFVYADLSFTGHARGIRMPDKQLYLIDHPRDAQDLLWGIHLHTSVITEIHWWGAAGNDPWAGIADPVGYARGCALDICVRLREAECDLRIAARVPVVCRAGRHEASVNVSRLELCLSPRRRIELARSA
jgi:hypothetical protein